MNIEEITSYIRSISIPGPLWSLLAAGVGAFFGAYLTFAFNKRTHFSKVRYDREMKIYKTLWRELRWLYKTATSIDPLPKSNGTDNTEIDDFKKKLQAAFDAIEDNRPFYSDEIRLELRGLHEMCHSSLFHVLVMRAQGSPFDEREFEKWRKFWGEGEKKLDRICNAIRVRLKKFDGDSALNFLKSAAQATKKAFSSSEET